MRSILCLYFLLLTTVPLSGDVYAQTNTNDIMRIASIGNSITFGARLTNPSADSYPAVLQQMVEGKNIEVKNFGISGATMIRFGKPNVWQELGNIKSYLPNVVIIILGTNETVGANTHNWEHISDFEKDYTDFLSQLRSLSSHPVIFICSPPDMNLKTPGLSQERIQDLALRRPRLWELRKRIKKISDASNVHFIDLTSKFKNKPKLFTPSDGVHPNKQGYRFLAKLIFEEIRKTID